MLNRKNKREIEREYMEVAKAQDEIDTLFNDMIFGSESSYKEAFKICNEVWQKVCKELNKKLKYTKANEKYFYETYKPLEKEN